MEKMNMQGKWRRKKKGRKRSVARKLQSKFWWGERKEREAVRVRAARETGCAGHDTITMEYQIKHSQVLLHQGRLSFKR